MTDIQMPREAVKAAVEAFTEAMLTVPQPDPIEAALRAGLKAWPGSAVCHYTIADDEGCGIVLPLPLPAMENTNAEA